MSKKTFYKAVYDCSRLLNFTVLMCPKNQVFTHFGNLEALSHLCLLGGYLVALAIIGLSVHLTATV